MNAPDWALIERSRDADRYSERMNYAERHSAEVARVARELTLQWLAGDFERPFEEAAMVTDRSITITDPDRHPMRWQTVGECVRDSLDYRLGPTTDDALKLLARVAKGEDVKDAAAELIAAAAVRWAETNVEVE